MKTIMVVSAALTFCATSAAAGDPAMEATRQQFEAIGPMNKATQHAGACLLLRQVAALALETSGSPRELGRRLASEIGPDVGPAVRDTLAIAAGAYTASVGVEYVCPNGLGR